MKIGILAIQGSVIEHRAMLEKLDVEVIEVRLPEDLEGIDGIILPGGESTTQSKLMIRFGVFDLLKKKIEEGLPVWGTCAGSILLAKTITGKVIPTGLEVMDIVADRNAYGAQLDSFEINLEADLSGLKTIKSVFIRAPKIHPHSDEVQVLCSHGGQPVMLRQKNMLASSFHPELTDDVAVHQYFVEMCKA